MTIINLIPAHVLEERHIRRCMRRWSVRLVTCAAILGGLYAGIVRVATGPNAEVRKLSEQVEQLQVRFRGAEGLIGERDRLAKRQEAIASISDARRTGWYLEEVGRALTPESYLNYLGLDRCFVAEEQRGDRARRDDCRANLSLRGYAPGHSDVGKVLAALKATGAFEDVTLASVTELPGERGQRSVRFHMECRLAQR